MNFANEQPGRAHEPQQKPNQFWPVWLRPLLVVVVLLAHASAFAGFAWFSPEQVTPLPDVEVELIPEGETVTQTSTVPTPEAAPVVTPDKAALASPDNDVIEKPDTQQPPQQTAQATPPQEITAPPPKIVVPDAPPIPIAKPHRRRPIKKRKAVVTSKERSKDVERREANRRAALQARVRARREMHARQLGLQAQLGAPAVRAGMEKGSARATRMSETAYGALVSAEINRHKIYPASARSEGVTGNVAVVFTVGPSGAIVSRTITRSSGNAALDAAVRAMMAAAHPPPPPNGRFRGSVVIHFDLGR